MPMISLNALLKTVAEQDAQIKELKNQIVYLQSLLEHQDRIRLAQELVDLVKQYPEALHYPIVASTETH